MDDNTRNVLNNLIEGVVFLGLIFIFAWCSVNGG